MSLSAFLAENALSVENVKFVASKRFLSDELDDKGKRKPMEWEIKAITGATTRCYTLDYDPEAHGDTCIFCGKKAKHLMYFGKAY